MGSEILEPSIPLLNIFSIGREANAEENQESSLRSTSLHRNGNGFFVFRGLPIDRCRRSSGVFAIFAPNRITRVCPNG